MAMSSGPIFQMRQMGKSAIGDLTRQYCRTFGKLEKVTEAKGMRHEYYRMSDGSIYLLASTAPDGDRE